VTGNNAPDPRVVYADIINLPRWESPTRPRMSRYNRAAQFSPFAALTGYDDIIREEARETGTWIEPGESQKEQIDWRLNEIAAAISEKQKPSVQIVYFVPDTKKDGGEYVTAKGSVRKIDPVRRRLLLANEDGQKQEIALDRITSIDPD
jgi:hypothetical protein